MIPNPRSVALRLLSTGRSGADHTRRLLVASALAIMLAACALPAGRDARAYNTCIARHPGEAALCEGPLIGLAQSSDPGQIEYTRLGEIIRCPWHGWEFDIRTGQSYCAPKRFRAKAYPVNVEPGASVVKGPYMAETIAVSIESDYVVVDL